MDLVNFELPLELLDLVLSFTSRETLKNARLVSRGLNELAKRHLFRTVYLKVNVNSFLKAETLSKQDHLRGYVQKLVYDPALLPWNLNTFEEYLMDGAGSGFHLGIPYPASEGPDDPDDPETLRVEFLSRFTVLQLQYHWSQHQRHLSDQKFLHREKNELNLLTELFKRYHRLQTIEVPPFLEKKDRSRIPYDVWAATPTKALAYASITAQKTLIEPHKNRFRMKRILTSMQAAVAASRSVTTLDTGLLDLNDMVAALQKPFCSYLSEFLNGLNRLEMCYSAESANIRDHLSYILALVPNLSSLSLTYSYGVRATKDDYFPSDASQLQWPSLKDLHLRGVRLDREGFPKLLLRHATHLKSLRLNNIHLDGHPREILTVLAEEMSLKHLEISGLVYTNDSSDFWRIPAILPRKSHDSVNRPSLLQCIKHYVKKSSEENFADNGTLFGACETFWKDFETEMEE